MVARPFFVQIVCQSHMALGPGYEIDALRSAHVRLCYCMH